MRSATLQLTLRIRKLAVDDARLELSRHIAAATKAAQVEHDCEQATRRETCLDNGSSGEPQAGLLPLDAWRSHMGRKLAGFRSELDVAESDCRAARATLVAARLAQAALTSIDERQRRGKRERAIGQEEMLIDQTIQRSWAS